MADPCDGVGIRHRAEIVRIPFGVPIHEMDGHAGGQGQPDGLDLAVRRFQRQIDKGPVLLFVMDHRQEGKPSDPLKDFVFQGIRVLHSEVVRLPQKKTAHVFDLPEAFRSRNVLVEVVAGGVTKAEACFSSALAVQLIESYGQLKVTHETTGKPLPKVYVKVYARMRGGAVRFYKDGYTDLRGRFDYASLSTNDLDAVEKFSILLLSEEHGATVREAAPPKR